MTTPAPTAGSLLERFFQGNPRALSRLLSLLENGHHLTGRVLEAVYPHARNAYRIGLTGAPGAGKSTLGNRLTALLVEQGISLAVLAVDPTSPFTGGAVLGDRIRFAPPPVREGQKPVFFRSAASRGHQGGLARATEEMSVLLDAFGYERLLIESVGVGQVGLDIAEACDTTVVIVVPESGDEIQALKAGLLEIADVLVVNKADRPGAETLAHELEDAVHYRRVHHRRGWVPPVVCTEGQSGAGLPDLLAHIEAHRRFRLAEEGDGGLTRQRLRQVILNLLREEMHELLGAEVRRGCLPDGRALDPLLDAIQQGRENPFHVVRQTLRTLLDREREGPPR